MHGVPGRVISGVCFRKLFFLFATIAKSHSMFSSGETFCGLLGILKSLIMETRLYRVHYFGIFCLQSSTLKVAWWNLS